MNKNVIKIDTRIDGVEGDHAYHYTITTDPTFHFKNGISHFIVMSFQTNINFFTKIYVKISIRYPVPGFEPTTSWI